MNTVKLNSVEKKVFDRIYNHDINSKPLSFLFQISNISKEDFFTVIMKLENSGFIVIKDKKGKQIKITELADPDLLLQLYAVPKVES